MDIFTIEKNVVIPSTHALLIPEFRALWNRDQTEKKSRATIEFSFIEFVLSERKTNPFAEYPEDQREAKVKQILNLPKEWTPDPQLIKALDRYDELQQEASQSLMYYRSVKKALHKLTKFYNDELDFSKVNNSGTPVYKPKDITDAISKAAINLKQLQDIKKKVEKELFEANKTIKNRDISEYEKRDSARSRGRTKKYGT